MKLNVYLGNEKAGFLESTENRGVIFLYDKDYLQKKMFFPCRLRFRFNQKNSLRNSVFRFSQDFYPRKIPEKKLLNICMFLKQVRLNFLKLLEVNVPDLLRFFRKKMKFRSLMYIH